MSQTLFSEIKENLKEVIAGRQYLISSIEKLRKGMPDFKPSLDNLAQAITGLEAFAEISRGINVKLDAMQTSIQSVNSMAVGMETLRKDMQQLQNDTLSNKLILESIKNSNDKQSLAIVSLNNNIQQLGQLMGSILAKLEN